MNTTVKLNKIANIWPGYPFRTSLKKLAGNEINVIQAKDAAAAAIIESSSLSIIKDIDFRQKYYVKPGDIILSARGYLRAGVVDQAVDNTVASASVYIIRLKTKKIIPKYLAIYLNSRIGQKKLNARATGAVINTILRNDLENIKIKMPGLGEQKQIITVYENNQAQQLLLERKKYLTNKINQSLINKLCLKGINGGREY